MKEEEMKIIADVFTRAIKNHNNDNILEWLKSEILDLCKRFPIYK
jgi:glycine/serine hydroxymethyltransferase